jgi:hypothetical protein
MNHPTHALAMVAAKTVSGSRRLGKDEEDEDEEEHEDEEAALLVFLTLRVFWLSSLVPVTSVLVSTERHASISGTNHFL